MAIYGKRSASLHTSIQQNRTHEETICHLALFLASESSLCIRSPFSQAVFKYLARVVRSTNPAKCVLVVARPAISLLVDAPPTLVGASSGGSSLASTMTFVAACIYGIFCPPSRSTNSGTLSVSMIGLLRHWVLRSRSGRCCPTPHFCFLVMFV